MSRPKQYRGIWELGCDGSLGCDCPQKRQRYTEQYGLAYGHGTRQMYTKGCRCVGCRDANSEATRKHRRLKRAVLYK